MKKILSIIFLSFLNVPVFQIKIGKLAQEAPGAFSVDFEYGFNEGMSGNWSRELQEHFPSTFNKDLIKKCQGIGPGSSRTIFH